MSRQNIRVLVADDMPTMRSMAIQHLRELGFARFDEAADGTSAFAILEKAHAENAPVELVFSDMNMPGMGGLEFLRNVRKDVRFHKLPFIMITGERELDQVKEAILSGVTGYLVKPFTREFFLARIEPLLKKSLPGR